MDIMKNNATIKKKNSVLDNNQAEAVAVVVSFKSWFKVYFPLITSLSYTIIPKDKGKQNLNQRKIQSQHSLLNHVAT